MSAAGKTMKVTIIGAGVAGLALAQILRRAGVDYEIFERDDGSRFGGWSVGLDRCLKDLTALLPLDLPSISTLSPNILTERTDSFTFMDASSHTVLGTAPDPEAGLLFVPRDKLKRLLSANLTINYGKRFESYAESKDGIETLFTDGSKTSSNILVAADGARSAVRTQLLHTNPTTPSDFIVFNGDVELNREAHEAILEHSGCGVIASAPDIKFYILLTAYSSDRTTAWFNWNFAWRSHDYKRDEAWSQQASRTEILRKTLSAIQGFPAYIVNAVKQTPLHGIFQPPVKLYETVLPDQDLPVGCVTLLGDSAHSMVPFRGMGANTALLDACDLGRAIIRGVQSREEVKAILKRYEKIMIPRGRGHVLDSRATAEGSDATELAGGRLNASTL